MPKAKNYLLHPKEYVSWCSLKQRCSSNDPEKLRYYKNIEVCLEWKFSFETFLRQMGKAPSTEHTIDRIDNSKGYYKDNCRWATPKQQANNRTNNVDYHIHHKDRYWIVRKYKDGVRTHLGRYKDRALVTLLYGV